ncbi:branched-chain amino acid ABC transporter permease [Aquamicrobium segne]|uniref:Branched-chain amino acid ABC transporter permease n=1 Tax=Aquamicrobium segne TaxID=469547 RepID=A0ABW0GTL5_9HYPH
MAEVQQADPQTSAVAMAADRAESRTFWIVAVPGLAVLTIAPLLSGAYFVALLTEILIFAILTSGLNLLVGYTGLVSLGHAAFLGVGAYVTAIISLLWGYPVWLAMIAAVAAGLVISCLIGVLSVRTRGVQFLLITLAFGQLFHAVAEKSRYTGGDDGMTRIPRINLEFIGLDSSDAQVFYFFVLACFVVALFFLRIVVRSPFGRVLIGIRENEKRVQAVGYRISPYKSLAFAFSGMLAGLSGSLWVQHTYFINPHLMTWQMSGEALLMVIIGGSQAFFGPLLGSAFYVLLKSYLSTITDAYLVIFGLMFVFVVAFFNGGIAGFTSSMAARVLAFWRRR